MKPGHIPNISERGARRRLRGGIMWLAIGLAAWVVLLVRREPLGWDACLIVPFTLAAVGWLQAREKT